MDLNGILQVIDNSRLVHPDKNKSEETSLGSTEAFMELLEKSCQEPEKFWSDVAKELVWYEPWTETISGSLPDFKFFC
ncbi:acetyl-coenzyme A synthetase N-terminal domain-containing protein [Virgibacillus halophilus]|uniref:Acetyl-coenzyme A synthetase N-terminal domain-containing protein n=1 Tax=Tigheibacillus halophilus TaxID=361280 RepID=A0ABU5CA19_9BACI|nr:acetyl-coenzyme A synthetase N-terminal domain-containing protein [Virgibacillus halophilus]